MEALLMELVLILMVPNLSHHDQINNVTRFVDVIPKTMFVQNATVDIILINKADVYFCLRAVKEW